MRGSWDSKKYKLFWWGAGEIGVPILGGFGGSRNRGPLLQRLPVGFPLNTNEVGAHWFVIFGQPFWVALYGSRKELADFWGSPFLSHTHMGVKLQVGTMGWASFR